MTEQPSDLTLRDLVEQADPPSFTPLHLSTDRNESMLALELWQEEGFNLALAMQQHFMRVLFGIGHSRVQWGPCQEQDIDDEEKE
jgi:hypothetical protein